MWEARAARLRREGRSVVALGLCGQSLIALLLPELAVAVAPEAQGLFG